MVLTYTSYYGTNGELLKAYNIVEPFTINDITNTGRMTDYGLANSKVEEWLGDTWQNIYEELMKHPNNLASQLAETTTSGIMLDNGDYKVELQLRTRANLPANDLAYGVVQDTRREGTLGPGAKAANGNIVGPSSGYLFTQKEGEDQERVGGSMYVGIYGPIDVTGYTPQNDTSGPNNGGAPVLVRDYTGEVFVISLGVFAPGANTTRNRVEGISVNHILRAPLYMDKLFWESLNNDAPEIGEDEGIVDINERFAPRVGMMGMGIYPLFKEDLQDFVYDLWTETFAEKILKFVNGDVMNNVISIRWFYGIGGSIPRTEDHAYLRLGNQSMKGDLGTRTVTTRPATSELMTYSMGSLLVPRKYNNFLDLSPFTKLQLFVPYVGFVNLDMTEFAGKRLRLDYNINIVSGAAIAYIYVQNSDNSWRIAYEQATSMGVEIPLNVNSRESMATRMTTAIAGAGTMAAGAAVGSVIGPLGAVGGAMAGMGVSQSVLGGAASHVSNGISGLSGSIAGSPSNRNGGGIDNETGSLGDFQPSIIITRPKAIPPSDYNMQVGLPDNNSGTVGSFSGYIKAGAIKQSNVNGLPRQAIDEIEQMLRAGVYTQ